MKSQFNRHFIRIASAYFVISAAMLMAASIKAATPGQSVSSPAQTSLLAQEFTKTIKKEFPISTTGTVNLINKYGKVDVKTWDKARTKIDVTIVVKAGSESEAQRVFDRIRIDFTNDDNFVKAETVIDPAKNTWWNWGSSRSEFQINYEVFMPQSGSLQLNNKYGDSFVAPIGGRADVDVKYGNFRLEGIGSDLTVKLGYGSGTIVKARDAVANVSYSKAIFNNVRDVKLETSYSKITLDNAADLNVDSRYDQFTIAKAANLNCQSRYGNFEVNDLGSIVANARYTDFKIGRIAEKADFDLQYGGVRMDQLAKGFSSVNLIGKYSDFKIDLEPGATYTFDAATNYAGITYPSAMTVTFEKDKGTSQEVRGYSGSQSARSSIKANLSYGGLKVRQ